MSWYTLGVAQVKGKVTHRMDDRPKLEDMIPPKLPPPSERRRIREASGLSARQLAKVVGVSYNTLYRWERGHREPYGDRRVAYHAALSELFRLDAKGKL